MRTSPGEPRPPRILRTLRWLIAPALVLGALVAEPAAACELVVAPSVTFTGTAIAVGDETVSFRVDDVRSIDERNGRAPTSPPIRSDRISVAYPDGTAPSLHAGDAYIVTAQDRTGFTERWVSSGRDAFFDHGSSCGGPISAKTSHADRAFAEPRPPRPSAR